VRDWLSRIDKDDREKRDKRIFEMWLACYTHEEIAQTEEVDRSIITRRCDEIVQNGDIAKSHKSNAEHLADFDPPIYNIWKQQNKVMVGGKETTLGKALLRGKSWHGVLDLTDARSRKRTEDYTRRPVKSSK
jgi:hypothetical protein